MSRLGFMDLVMVLRILGGVKSPKRGGENDQLPDMR